MADPVPYTEPPLGDSFGKPVVILAAILALALVLLAYEYRKAGRLKDEVQRHETAAASLKKQVDSLENKREEISTQLASTQKALEDATGRVKAMEENKAQLEELLRKEEAVRAKADKELARLRDDAKSMQSALELEQARRKAVEAEKDVETAKVKAETSKAEAEKIELRKSIETLQTRLKALDGLKEDKTPEGNETLKP